MTTITTPSHRTEPDRLLRRVVTVDALTSGLLGLGMLAATAVLPDALGIPRPVLVVVEAVTLAWAGWLMWLLRAPVLDRRAVRAMVGGNALWAVASVVVVVAADGLTSTGRLVVLTVAALVADYALLQWWGLRRLAR